MTIDELVKNLEREYEIDYDEYLGTISVFANNERKIVLDLMLEFDEENSNISIYQQFVYSHFDSLIKQLATDYQKLLFIQNLSITSKILPETNVYIPMGCPFDEEQVGYFRIEANIESIFETLDWFANIKYDSDNLDYNFLKEKYPMQLNMFLELENKVYDYLKSLELDGWSLMSDHKETSYEKSILN